MAIRRGDIYDYELPTLRDRAHRSTQRLVITADDLNAEPEQMLMVGLQVRAEDPGDCSLCA